jgi:hypothetical protein
VQIGRDASTYSVSVPLCENSCEHGNLRLLRRLWMNHGRSNGTPPADSPGGSRLGTLLLGASEYSPRPNCIEVHPGADQTSRRLRRLCACARLLLLRGNRVVLVLSGCNTSGPCQLDHSWAKAPDSPISLSARCFSLTRCSSSPQSSTDSAEVWF